VVFSDQTLDTFKALRSGQPTSAFRRRFAYCGRRRRGLQGAGAALGGNGFCGCSRVALLKHPAGPRARISACQMRFQREVGRSGGFADSDLVVIADGINSRIRSKYADHFSRAWTCAPTSSPGSASTRPLDAFKYFFRETPEGIILAHCYQYEADPLHLGDRDREANLAPTSASTG